LREGVQAEAVPPVGHAVAGEPTGVVAQAEIDVAEISLAIVDAMRMKHAVGHAGKIVIESLQWFLRVKVSGTKQKSQEFLVFRVNTENRIRRFFVFGTEAGNDPKLLVALGVAFQRQILLSFAASQVVPIKQLGHDRNADMEAALGEFSGDLSTRKIGPQNAFTHGIAGNTRLDDVEESSIETGKQRQTGFSSAPFFRERPGGEQTG
jgi:hypothetical protein